MSLTLGIDNDLKSETRSNLKKMGLDMTTATKMFYIYINQHGKLPFTPSVGRSELEQAVYEAKHHQFAGEYKSLEEMRKDLYSDED
ncbi:type II toxin-antitoxin system RelB/DinJ family antitoxin [Lactobacillus sp. LL6]|uniref:type II toxin-antitoxin system RelB/DinJ family antitoxin n=1 Tax=Lactobacillus sp. LL6 TaxID=2596827 RepID=UPI0011865CD6|nr:type II toxin-antitoxin system RelB/DinJ family antitoxin [Lactobacillus sp. LL6]TSO26320.1 type II toxin-antitoxin system RelB/DinJ family antitoxin [Lactobacillus sp. LL6]